MEKKNNNLIIILMVVIIVILILLCILFSTDTITFKNKINNTDNLSNDIVTKDNETNNDIIKNQDNTSNTKINIQEGKYERGKCNDTGMISCSILEITKVNDDSFEFKLEGYWGIVENGPNIGLLKGTATLTSLNTYKYTNTLDDSTDNIEISFIDENTFEIKEEYINPYSRDFCSTCGHNVRFEGTYNKS